MGLVVPVLSERRHVFHLKVRRWTWVPCSVGGGSAAACVTRPNTGQVANEAGGDEFHACKSQVVRPDMARSEGDGRLYQARYQVEGRADARFIVPSQLLSRYPSRRAKSREMSDTGHCPCLERRKGAAFAGDRPAPSTQPGDKKQAKWLPNKALAEEETEQERYAPARKTKRVAARRATVNPSEHDREEQRGGG